MIKGGEKAVKMIKGGEKSSALLCTHAEVLAVKQRLRMDPRAGDLTVARAVSPPDCLAATASAFRAQ